VACAQEILVASHSSNLEAVFLKLDFEKAFGSISWDFLLSYYWQEDLSNAGLDKSKLVSSPKHYPSLLMGSQATISNVVSP